MFIIPKVCGYDPNNPDEEPKYELFQDFMSDLNKITEVARENIERIFSWQKEHSETNHLNFKQLDKKIDNTLEDLKWDISKKNKEFKKLIDANVK